jgi:hypothetical protein
MLVGRRDVVDRIYARARLVDPRGNRRELRAVQIVQLTGPPHDGKTELLTALADKFGPMVPVGWFDFAHARAESRNHEILNHLVFLLSRPRDKEFGQLAFPRLLATLIAMKQDLGNSRDQAVANITRALEDPRSVELTRQVIAALADDATKIVQQVPGGQLPGSGTIGVLAPEIVLTAMRHNRLGRRALSPLARGGLGAWPGMTTPGSTLDAVYQTLADINFHLKSPDPRERELGEAQPWGAFLADIRAGYDQAGRNLCTLLVLDNIDRPAGRQFIRGLASACAERRRRLGARGDAVPLLVIAAGRQPVTWDDAAWAIHTEPLPGLGFKDIRDMAGLLEVSARAAAEEAVHALSAGHKGIAEDLLAYCKQPAYPYDLAPGVNLRRRLLPDVGDDDFAALVTCAPAVDVAQVEKIIQEAEDGADPTVLPGYGLRGILGELGWLSGAVIHPGIRNLLLRELALRPDYHDWSWAKACQRLRGYPPAQIPGLASRDSRKLVNQAYYGLAAGQVAKAMGMLGSIRPDDPEWLAAFDWVITAPHPYGSRHQPRLLARRVADDANRELADTAIRGELTKLVVACQLATGRHLDPWHELDQVIARGYETVAPLVGGDEFYQRAERYRESAHWWRHSGQADHPRPEPTLPNLPVPSPASPTPIGLRVASRDPMSLDPDTISLGALNPPRPGGDDTQ